MKKIIIVALITLIFSCNKENDAEPLTAKNSIPTFSNKVDFLKTVEHFSQLTSEQRQNEEKTRGYISMKTAFENIIMAEWKVNDEAEKLVQGGKKVTLYHSKEYEEALKKGLIIESKESDGSTKFDLNIISSSEIGAINADGLVMINDSLYRFEAKTLKYINGNNEHMILSNNEKQARVAIEREITWTPGGNKTIGKKRLVFEIVHKSYLGYPVGNTWGGSTNNTLLLKFIAKNYRKNIWGNWNYDMNFPYTYIDGNWRIFESPSTDGLHYAPWGGITTLASMHKEIATNHTESTYNPYTGQPTTVFGNSIIKTLPTSYPQKFFIEAAKMTGTFKARADDREVIHTR